MTYKTKEEAIESLADHYRGVKLGYFSLESILGHLWDEALDFSSSQGKEKGNAGPDVSKKIVWSVSVVDDTGMVHDFTTKQKFAQGVSGVDDWIGWERYEGGYVQFDLKRIKSIHSMPIGKDGD